MLKKLINNFLHKFVKDKYGSKENMPDALETFLEDSDGNGMADAIEHPEVAKQKIAELKEKTKNDPASLLKK
jgi:hypothetical protein